MFSVKESLIELVNVKDVHLRSTLETAKNVISQLIIDKPKILSANLFVSKTYFDLPSDFQPFANLLMEVLLSNH